MSAIDLHRQMIALYGGTANNERCGECQFCRGVTYNRTYWKCTKAKLTHGAATDWRLKWDACGKFQPKENEG